MATSQERHRPAIAIVGVSALFPGSVDSTGFWSDILAGTDRMTDVPPSHWLIEDYYDGDMSVPDKTYGRRGGFLDPIPLDVMGFGIPPVALPSTDTAQLLALIVAQRVLEDATTGQFSELDRSRASVILGVTSGQELLGAMASRMNRPLWLQGMRRAGVPEDVALAACDQISDLHPEWTESTFPGLLGNVVAGRIANRLDLGGTNCVTDAACASSFSALSMGVNELYLGDSDLVIVGGVDTMNDIFMYMCFSKTPALSPTEDIRPFSDQADGTMLGEGIGMVALKRLEDAERDGNHIYCVVNGVGASSDGRSKSVYAPVSSGQARALTNAYDKAGYGPDTVELIEAHGTGTVAGDAAEFGGLELAFNGSGREDRQWCGLGSVKSQIGHTKAAAGAAGLFKVVMALHHKVLPQTAKIDRPNPDLDLENSPFHLNTRTRPWVRGADHERRGSVSSFGFGGSNFHIALSEYTGDGLRAPRLSTRDAELVILCGDGGHDIVDQARSHRDAADLGGYVRWLAQSSQKAYNHQASARLAMLVTDEDDLRSKLLDAIGLLEKNPDSPFSTPNNIHYDCGDGKGEVAFVFPGQGSQYPFMGGDVAAQFSEAIAPWDIAADIDWPERSLHGVVFPITTFAEDAETTQQLVLTETQWAQPAIGATSLSYLRLLRLIGVEAKHLGGHSFGEITALHAAGVLSEVNMLEVARRRGQFMAAATELPGAMTAVAGSVETVTSIVDDSAIDVVVANHNTHNQVVLSGASVSIEEMETRLSDEGISFKRLPVGTAFHSPLVSGASDAFCTFLESVEFESPLIAVHANETAQPYPQDPTSIRSQLGRQLATPVRFVEMIESMYELGARTFVEVGPSSVLTGLIDQILKGRQHRAIPLDKKKQAGLGAFLDGIGQLAAAGVPMDLSYLWAEYGELQDPHALETPKLTVPISGANYGSPYPPQDLSTLASPNASGSNEHGEIDTLPVTAPDAAQHEGQPPEIMDSTSPDPNPPAVRSALPAAATPTADVFAAFQAVQRETARAHTEYMKSMAQVHSSFLNAAQQSIAMIAQMGGGAPVTAATTTVVEIPPTPTVSTHDQVILASSAPVPAVVAPIEQPTPARVQDAVAVGFSVDELTVLLLGVVSDKTGYPSEMLTMAMELEADLGIDSIKRVEILSAMQDEAPGLPEVDTSVMAELVTLGQIVEYMAGEMQSAVVEHEAPLPKVSRTAVATASGSSVSGNGAVGFSVDELTVLLLGVVSDKTGYPSEMLTMAMELEADLGIDSIKRVEILSAMQDEAPGLPEVDTSVMAELVTLGQIVEYMAGEFVAPEDTGPATIEPLASGSEPLGSSPSPKQSTFHRYSTNTVDVPSPGIQTPGLADGRIAITDDDSGVGPALVELLIAAGIDASLAASGASLNHDGVIFLGGLREFNTIEDAVGANREGFRVATDWVSASKLAKLFVTVSDLGGDFGRRGADPVRVWSAGLTGLARTAALEWPNTTVRAIDIERRDRDPFTVAKSIAEELLAGGAESEVGLGFDGSRVAICNDLSEVRSGTMPLDPSDVVVVSGGARGVTAATMVELARESKATFVLLGRSALESEPDICNAALDDASLKRVLLDAANASGDPITPNELAAVVARILANREIRQTLAAIEEAGGNASYMAVDVTDRTALGAVLTGVRSELGPITAVVHGAGVIQDKLIGQKSVSQFNLVFDTKVAGLRALLDETDADQLKLLCLFSSVAARTGNNGQVDYSMANEVLNKVAVAEGLRRGSGCVVKSLGWGPWDGGMVGPSLRAHFESVGVSLIPLGEGARMLVDEIASQQADQIEVVLGGGVLPTTNGLVALGVDG